MSVADLHALDKEYQDLKTKYKNNYEVVEFYPTKDSATHKRVGCIPSNNLNMQRIDNQLHTMQSCKMAVSLLESSSATPLKAQGIHAKIENKTLNTKETKISTNLSSLQNALGDKLPSKENKFNVMWSGFIQPDITGDWGITITTNCVIYFWYGEFANEMANGVNASVLLVSATAHSITIPLTKDKPMPILIRIEHQNTEVQPTFSLQITAPSASIYSSPAKMYECLYRNTNADGTLYQPPYKYFGLVENTPEDTQKNRFQCHYATTLNEQVPYLLQDKINGMYLATEEILVWSLFNPAIPEENALIKPGNTIKIDATGVHVFNAQGAIVKTMYANTDMSGITLGLAERNNEVRFSVFKQKDNDYDPVIDLKTINVVDAVPSYKWYLDKTANGYKEYTNTVISFAAPLISTNVLYKLAIDTDGNCSIYASKIGCSKETGDSARYRQPSQPHQRQYIYGIQTDNKFNKTYYVNKQSNSMQYLPRNNPMLANVNTYTMLPDVLPSSRTNATNATSVECKTKCNDISSCSWYSTYRENDVQKCVLGTSQTENIVSPDMMLPMPAEVSSASLFIRHKEIPLNEKYMLGDNIPFKQVMESSGYTPYSSYIANGSPITGTTPLGILSESDVKNYFVKQRQTLGVQEGFTSGVSIYQDASGRLQYIESNLINPSLQASDTFNRHMENIRVNEDDIRRKIGEYTQVRDTMNAKEKYRFNPAHVSLFGEKPTLIDGILEDNKELAYHQNLIYLTTGVAVLTLGVAAAMVLSRK